MVERAEPHLLRRQSADQVGQAPLHLMRCSSGECDSEDASWVNALLSDQPCDAVSDDPGLAAARAGDDQERAGPMSDSGVLLRVELREIDLLIASHFLRIAHGGAKCRVGL